MNNEQKKFNLNVDLSALPFMECYCGCIDFVMIYRIKYISPLHCGDPKGGSAQFPVYRCHACEQEYPGAMSKPEIEKIRKSATMGLPQSKAVHGEST